MQRSTVTTEGERKISLSSYARLSPQYIMKRISVGFPFLQGVMGNIIIYAIGLLLSSGLPHRNIKVETYPDVCLCGPLWENKWAPAEAKCKQVRLADSPYQGEMFRRASGKREEQQNASKFSPVWAETRHMALATTRCKAGDERKAKVKPGS